MYRSIMSTRGRITIPAELRKKLRLTLSEEKGRLVLTPFERLVDEMQGFLKPRPGQPSVFEELFEERKRERTREDLKALK
jgi:bifunctional DNA-binding transcriptional regulator/antitoxin component of YhaV-PrlF toxin-antitoxin module